MHVVVFAARKGGASKTTLTAHLGIEAARRGHGPVLLMDTDPQQSLREWWDLREAEAPGMVDAKLDTLAGEVAKVRGRPGLLMIDTPPLEAATIEKVISVADLVVIPVKPSPHDLKGVGVTVRMAKAAGKPFIFVVTQAVPRASLTMQAPLALSQHGPVATTIMHYRVDYAGSMTDGRVVQEVDPNGKAAEEMAALWEYVHAYIRNHVSNEISNSVEA
jgi:chromosome partitioning protein